MRIHIITSISLMSTTEEKKKEGWESIKMFF